MSGTSPAPTASLFARLLAAGREAHEARRHETAYHALMAAMHAANDDGDRTALADVAAEARAQIAWIDAHAPAHRLATASAARHNHPGVFEMLARQAETHRELLAQGARRPPAAPHDAAE